MSRPPVRDDEALQRAHERRIRLLERRIAAAGGGGGGSSAGRAFMTPTSVTGGTFDPETGRITLTPGATGVTLNGVFTSEYRAYKIYFGWYTGTANNLALRLCQNGTAEQAAVYEWSGVANSGNSAGGSETNTGTYWGISLGTQPGWHGEVMVMEPMTTEYTNNQKRMTAVVSGYGNVANVIGGIMAGRDTTPYDGFTILNVNAGPGVSATSGSWVMVVPVPTSRVGATSGSGGGAHLAGDIWQIGNGSTPPAGTLLCDGRAVSRTTYAELFAKIGTTYGDGDGSTTFNLPLLNGKKVSVAGETSQVVIDGIFPAIGQHTSHVPDAWDIIYTLDAANTTSELRAQFRVDGANVSGNYAFSRDGYGGSTNLQNTSTGYAYFEPSWGPMGNTSGVIRVYRAGQPGHWTNYEGVTGLRSGQGGYDQGTLSISGSHRVATRLNGIALYVTSGVLHGFVEAIPVGGSLVPSVIAYKAGGGGTTPPLTPDKGTTADRDAAYPPPATSDQQVALHNRKVQWQNTEKGWTEQYYAAPGVAGANAPTLLTGFPAGWYPVAGSMLRVHRGKTNGFQAIPAGGNTDPVLAASQINIGGFVDADNSGVKVPVGGFYDIQGFAYFTGGGAMTYVISNIFRGGTQIVGDRVAAPNADVNADAHIVLDVQAGVTVALVVSASAAHNVWGTTGYNGCFLAVRYVGPPLANG